MATYKVIQDVEAEDKILGPLTLRQFIYAGIAALCLYLSYFVIAHRAGFVAVIFVPVALISAFFAAPWGRDQPTEIWALAKIRFILKPRRRIWDQSGTKELVTITAPKHQEQNYTNGLSEGEVDSRLRALADTLDSRGWAIKNADVNVSSQPPLIMGAPSSERLLSVDDFPQETSPVDIHAGDDILDEKNSPVAQHFDTMIQAATKAHRQKIVDSLRVDNAQPIPAAPPAAPANNNYWFLNQAGQSTQVPNDAVTFNTQVVTPGADDSPPAPVTPVAPTPLPDEQQLVQQLKARKEEMPMTAYYGHLHTVQPLSAQGQGQMQQHAAPPLPDTPQAAGVATGANNPAPQQQQQPTTATPQPVTPAQQAAILQLANNDDLDVATLAREAHRSGQLTDGEVVINLH